MQKPFVKKGGIYQPLNKKLFYNSIPPMQELRHFLAELSQSYVGGMVDFCFKMQGESYTLNLHCIKSENRNKWLLYNTGSKNSKIFWEKDTRDVSFIHALLLQTDSEIAFSQNKPQSNDELTPVEAALSSNELFSNLRKFLTEVGAAEHKTSEDKVVESINNEPGDLIDLSIGRETIKDSFLNDLGVLNYPAFLFCLVREYASANEYRIPLAIILIELNLSTDNVSSPLSQPLLGDFLSKLKILQRKTDIIGQYDLPNTFAIILPETEIDSCRYLSDRQRNLLSCLEREYGLQPGSIEIRVAISGANAFCNSIGAILGAAELTLAKVKERKLSVGTFDQLFPGQTPSVKNLDHCLIQQLAEKLIVEEYNIFSFPALVAFLEYEFHRSKRNKQSLCLLLISLKPQTENEWPKLPQAMGSLISRINSLQNGNYLLAQYNENCIAIFASRVVSEALETLGTQISTSIFDNPLSNDSVINSYLIDVQIVRVELTKNNANFFRIKPYHSA